MKGTHYSQLKFSNFPSNNRACVYFETMEKKFETTMSIEDSLGRYLLVSKTIREHSSLINQK